MIYVSLLVHENIDVIINQIDNLNKFYSNCIIIIHISKISKITTNNLNEKIKNLKIKNVIINNNQTDTSWGNVIAGHIANIEYIKNMKKRGIIVFHASNDMLISNKVENYVSTTKSAYNLRLVLPGSYWWPAHMVLQDKIFTNFVNSFNSGAIFASQIEGSFYETDVLFEIITLINKHNLLDTNYHYTKEEIFFSTLAHCIGYQPNGLPYIFSEVHDFDRILWSKFTKIDNNKFLNPFIKNKLKKILNNKLFKKGDYKINIKTVLSLLNKDTDFLQKKEYLNDGNYIWQIYDKNHLYGVKRINRNICDPVRKFISNL